jgi:hypothetical protein
MAASQGHPRSDGSSDPTEALTSLLSWRGVFRRRPHGRDIPVFDCYLSAQSGTLARGHNAVCAFRNGHPRPDGRQLCDARRLRFRVGRHVCSRKNYQETLSWRPPRLVRGACGHSTASWQRATPPWRNMIAGRRCVTCRVLKSPDAIFLQSPYEGSVKMAFRKTTGFICRLMPTHEGQSSCPLRWPIREACPAGKYRRFDRRASRRIGTRHGAPAAEQGWQ